MVMLIQYSIFNIQYVEAGGLPPTGLTAGETKINITCTILIDILGGQVLLCPTAPSPPFRPRFRFRFRLLRFLHLSRLLLHSTSTLLLFFLITLHSLSLSFLFFFISFLLEFTTSMYTHSSNFKCSSYGYGYEVSRVI